MSDISELDLQNLRHLIGGFDTTHCKMQEYAKSGSIRLGADAKAVEHDQKDTFFHLGFLHFFRVSPDK